MQYALEYVQAETIPVITRAMHIIPKRLATFIGRIGIPNIVSSGQISVITITARILCDVLRL